MHPFCLETLVRLYVNHHYHVESWRLYDMTISYVNRMMKLLDLWEWLGKNDHMVDEIIRQVVFHGGVR